MNNREIELKLGMEPAAMARLRRHPFLRTRRQGRPEPSRLRSVYYDTPDFTLASEGICLRVRWAGRRRLQTVKTAGTRVSGLFARSEWEWELTGESPDPQLLRTTGLPVLEDAGVVERLEPVFLTEVRRTVYRLAEEGLDVDLALDLGEVRAGDRTTPICEAELELVRGEPSRLYALALEIAAAVPVRVVTQSKSDRGYQLAAGQAPQAAKAVPLKLTPDMTVGEAVKTIARGCVGHLLANERSLVTAGDGEAVHQMRVALRRLRSGFKVFRPVATGPDLGVLREEIRWLLGALGPARDGDVFLSQIIAPVMARHADSPALVALQAHWRADRDARMAGAVTAVAERRFTSLVLGLGTWIDAGEWLAAPPALLDKPLEPFAAKVLSKGWRRLRRAGGRSLDGLTDEQLHAVRILAKQLRYALEFFSALWRRKEVKAFLGAMAELQDALGHLNDITVADRLLAEGDPDGGRAWAAGMVTGWHESRRPDLMRRAERAWRQVRRCSRPWEHRLE